MTPNSGPVASKYFQNRRRPHFKLVRAPPFCSFPLSAPHTLLDRPLITYAVTCDYNKHQHKQILHITKFFNSLMALPFTITMAKYHASAW